MGRTGKGHFKGKSDILDDYEGRRSKKGRCRRELAGSGGRGTVLYSSRQGPATAPVSTVGRAPGQRGGKGTIGNRSSIIVRHPGRVSTLRNCRIL